MPDLQKENKLLRILLRDAIDMLNDLFEHMPEDIRKAGNSVRLMSTLSKITHALNEMDQRDGTTLPTSNYRQ